MFDVVLLKVELEMCFLQFLRLNLPEIGVFIKIHSFHQICSFHQNLQILSKSTVFVKICGFHQNLRFSSKSAIFIKIRDFCHFSPGFQEDNIKCETKDHLPRKVIPIFLDHVTQRNDSCSSQKAPICGHSLKPLHSPLSKRQKTS